MVTDRTAGHFPALPVGLAERRPSGVCRGVILVTCVLAAAGRTAGGAEVAKTADRAGLALELPFEGDLVDTSGAKHACTSRGTVAFVDGRQGKCASFDGRSWVDTGLLQKELGEEFTVECWVNPGMDQGPHADVFGNHVPEGLGFVLQQDGANTNEFLAAYGAGAGRWVTTDVLTSPKSISLK